jgi:predicted RND superfamily exporter protein
VLNRFLARIYGHSSGMKHRILAWPVALAIIVIVHVVSGVFLLKLHFNNSPEVYYPANAPAVNLRNELRRDFPSDEMLTILFKGDDLYSQDFLTRLDKLVHKLEKHPLVDRVSTVTSVEKISATDEGFSVGMLIDPNHLSGTTPTELQRRVLSDRFAPRLLVSKDGHYLAMAIRPHFLNESLQRRALETAVSTAIADVGLTSHYAGQAGPVTLDVAQLESIWRDSAIFIPLTVSIGLLLLGWVVGRLRPVVIGAVAISTVVLPTIAAVAAFNQPYTMATAILPSLLAAYTLSTLLHLYSGIQRARVAGLARAKRVDRALSETLVASSFNVLTTGAGLLGLVWVPIPPIQVFGIASSLGTLLVFLTVFYLAPPFLVHWDIYRWPRRDSGLGKIGWLASKMTLFSMRHPKAILAVTVLSIVTTFPYILDVRVESDLLTFFKPDHPVSKDTKLIESKLSGVTTLEISLKGADRDSLKNVATLRAIREFQQWLEKLPEVDRTLSMADLVEEMNWAMNGENPAYRSLPDNDKLLRQYLLIYDGKDMYELVNREFQHTRILLNMHVHGTQEISHTIEKIRQRLLTHPLPGLKVDIGGYGRLFADQIALLVSGETSSFVGAFLQIFLFMAIIWRSPSAAAIGMLPNLAPLFFIIVLMGATGIYLDLATVMIASVVLGITVDDTIHLYHGYQHRLRAGMTPVFAIARSFESSGRAVMAVSLLLVVQFGLLTASNFIPTANFGLMTSVGLFSGQLFELLLLPALLLIKDGRKKPLKAPPAAAH